MDYNTITPEVLDAAAGAACDRGRREIVQIWSDGAVYTGTDYSTTSPGEEWEFPNGGPRVIATYDPKRSSDPWECIWPVCQSCGQITYHPSDVCSRCLAADVRLMLQRR